jgi:hypothetical protein
MQAFRKIKAEKFRLDLFLCNVERDDDDDIDERYARVACKLTPPMKGFCVLSRYGRWRSQMMTKSI